MLELELLRLAYAELLHRWGYDEERVQVLKLCRGARVTTSKYAYATARIAVLNGLDEKAGLGETLGSIHRPGARSSTDPDCEHLTRSLSLLWRLRNRFPSGTHGLHPLQEEATCGGVYYLPPVHPR